MLSTILDEQQAGRCGQEVVMFTLKKHKLKEASMCIWLIFSPLDWRPQLDLLTISSCLSVLRALTHSLPSSFRGCLEPMADTPCVLQYFHFSPILPPWSSSRPYDQLWSTKYKQKWYVSPFLLPGRSISALNHGFPCSLLLPGWTLKHGELEKRRYNVKAAGNGGQREQLPGNLLRPEDDHNKAGISSYCVNHGYSGVIPSA